MCVRRAIWCVTRVSWRNTSTWINLICCFRFSFACAAQRWASFAAATGGGRWRRLHNTTWRRIVGCGGGMENCRFGRSWFGSAMALNLSWWGRGGGSKTSLRIGGGWTKGRTGRSGFGIGAAMRERYWCLGLCRIFMNWSFGGGCSHTTSHPSSSGTSGNVRDCNFSFLLLSSLSLLLFRWGVGCWAATGCPDGQSELYIFSFLRCLGSDCWTGAYRSCWNDLPILSPHWGKHSASTMGMKSDEWG